MKLNLQTVLGALPQIVPFLPPPWGTVATGSLALGKLVGEVVGSFGDRPQEQATIKEAIADLAAENDEGHRRFQEKLAAAAQT